MANSEIRSDIAGKVIRIEAKPGAKLAADDPIVFLESMKMEIPVAAPMAGKLVEILVAEGDAVSEGDPIAIIEHN